jgi:hypothetical protein
LEQEDFETVLRDCNHARKYPRVALAGGSRTRISASDRIAAVFFIFIGTAYVINFSIYLFSKFVGF